MGQGGSDGRERWIQWGIAKNPGNPLRVKVVSQTIQSFDGVRYYLCGKYFQRDGKRLHRLVWERTHKRKVPPGFHVHHDDEDRANNQPGNLVLKRGPEHVRDHQIGHRRGVPRAAVEAAKAWHGSDVGREWHRKHYADHADTLHQRVAMQCAHCSKVFDGVLNGLTRFCSNSCKTGARKASGVDDEQRTCLVCGMGFVANRYVKKACCSRSCSAALSVRRRSGQG